VNGADSDGWTALHWAADEGHTSAVSTVKALLAGGASIEAANSGVDGTVARA